MRSASLFLCFAMVLPVQGATWYVRPLSWDSTGITTDGTSYETAFDGFPDIVWGAGGVTAGDTLYICDTWQYPMDFAYATNLIGGSGTAGHPITIRGDLTGHRGVIIAARKYLAGSFTDLGDGSYSIATSQSSPGGIWQGDPTGTPELLKHVGSSELVSDTDGSWYYDSSSRVIYVNPYDSSGMEDVYTTGLGGLYLNGQDHLVIDGLRLFGGAGNNGVVQVCKASGNDAEDVTIRNCEIAFGTFTGIYAAGSNTSNILIEDCVIHDSPTGTYTLHTGRVSHSYWTMRRVEVYSGRDTRPCYGTGANDRHALGGQGLRNWLVEYCYIHDWAGDGILNYVGSTSYTDNVTIRYNRIDNLNDDLAQNHHFGITRHGTNAADWATRTANWQIYGNVISNLGTGAAGDSSGDGAAIRLKGAGGGSALEPKVYNNTVYNCRMTLYWYDGGDWTGSGFRFQNNISLSPKTGGYHVYMGTTAGTRAVTMSNNCWYPGTSGGDNLFRWFGPNAASAADFVARASANGVMIESGSIVADPKFTNAAGGDFSLQLGSPCIDAGTSLGTDTGYALNPSSAWPNSVKTLDQDECGSRWEMGAYAYQQGVSYTITIAAPNGTVTKSLDKGSYAHGEMVSLQAVPNAGYRFVNWSGDLTGSSNPATLVMDGNKSVTANFALNTYTLSVNTFNGSVRKSPDKASYAPGEVVTLQAVASTGYAFSGWSGGLSGSGNPATLVMNSDKAVTANFVANAPTLFTLSVTAAGGTVLKAPDKSSFGLGEMVTLNAVPDTSYEFDSWAGAMTGGRNPGTLVMDSDKVVTANFRSLSPDTKSPTVADCRPEPDAIQVPLNSLVILRISDDGRGVDANTVTVSLGDTVVYAGNVPSYRSDLGVCRRMGTPASYTYAYQSSRRFDFDQTIRLTVHAADLAGNVMPEYSYSFTTEMRVFGRNLPVSGGLDSLDKGKPATVRDSAGNIWAVWHAGTVGQRDIYLSRLARGGDSFGDPVRLTTGAGDESNPDLAIGTDNRLYVVWQDNRRGSWDVYVKTSVDGITWPDERCVTDSKGNHVHPAIVVDSQSPSRAYIAWQDDGAGNQDIHVASSNDGFATKTVASITSDASDQTGPQMAVDASNTVYLVWTDRRNGSDDIYGASSVAGPWTNVPFVTGAGNQNSPAMAAEAAGTALHIAWVDDASGNQDIRYAGTNGLPASPLVGVSVVDDTLGANQTAPAIATVGTVGNGLKVFVGWRDERNITPNKGDADLYFVEVRTPAATNILVGDDGAGSDQSEPAMGIDSSGYPYVVWMDNRASAKDIYYCGSTYMDPEALASDLVSASAGGIVGKTPVSGLDGVSVVIPAGACAQDVTVSITPILNPQPNSAASVIPYDFGPSGLEFSLPVTITIPYAVAEFGGNAPVPCWYDSRTGTVSQQGIADVETLSISSSIHAMRFRATHFTPYVLLAASPSTQGVSGSASASGGGCSLSPVSRTSGALEFFLPYILLASVMIALRRRDGRRYPVSGEKPSRD